MIALDKDVAALSRADRLAGLRRIIPPQLIRQVLQESGNVPSACPRLPAAFMVHFVLALGLFCRDCYRQVFRWLRRWSPAGVPGRSTFCEARKRLGVRPLVLLAQRTVRLLAEPSTPGAFYRNLRLMALDGFVVDVPDTPANERVFGFPRYRSGAKRLSTGAGGGLVRSGDACDVEVAAQALHLGRTPDGRCAAA